MNRMNKDEYDYDECDEYEPVGALIIQMIWHHPRYPKVEPRLRGWPSTVVAMVGKHLKVLSPKLVHPPASRRSLNSKASKPPTRCIWQMPWDVIGLTGTWSKLSCGALKKIGTPKFDDQFPKNWASLGTFFCAPFPGKPWLSSPQQGLPSLSLLESVESGNPKRCRKVNHHCFRRMLPFYIFLRGCCNAT